MLIVLGSIPLLGDVRPAQAQGDGGSQPPKPTGNNSYCAICHSQPGRAQTLKDGSVLDLYVSPAVIADSIHGTNNPQGALGCVDCHGEKAFPHSGPSPESTRAFRIEASKSCTQCHNTLLVDSAHLEAIDRGDLNAATCVDCHRAHDTPPTEDQPTLVAAVCGNCHTDTFSEWSASPHAQMGNLGCAVCHLPHGQQMRIENTTALCLNCHRVPGNIYVHAKHLEQTDYEVTCASCHMAFDPTIQPMSGDKEPTDHHMLVNTASCNQCHEQLEASGAWATLGGADEQVIIERDALRAQVSTLEEQISERNVSARSSDQVDYVQLIQGLIVGLGVGIIAVLLVIPRLSRRSSQNGNDENGTDEQA
jgi:hypothetical protein